MPVLVRFVAKAKLPMPFIVPSFVNGIVILVIPKELFIITPVLLFIKVPDVAL